MLPPKLQYSLPPLLRKVKLGNRILKIGEIIPVPEVEFPPSLGEEG